MIPVAILAGGLATRLRPLTQTIPKALVEVAGEPFVAHQLRLLRRNGVEEVVLCVGHLGKLVERYVGVGAQFGLRVRFSYDGDTLLGTGGALRKALPLLGPCFFVLYGDSYLDVDYGDVVRAFHASAAPALMTVFANHGRWDTSNVIFQNGRIVSYDKKSLTREMTHIDYGLGILTADVLRAHVDNVAFDLADVYTELAKQGRLAGYEAKQRFYEIGTPAALAETSRYIEGKGP